MSILVNKNTKVITQGMTGATGSFHTEAALAYGTQMVAGVTPARAAPTFLGLPQFDTRRRSQGRHRRHRQRASMCRRHLPLTRSWKPSTRRSN